MIGKLSRLIVLTVILQTPVGCIPQKDGEQKAQADRIEKINVLENTIKTLKEEKSILEEEFESQITKLNLEISALNETNRLAILSMQSDITQLKSEYETQIDDLKMIPTNNVSVKYLVDRGITISSPSELKIIQSAWREKVAEIDEQYINALKILKNKYTKNGDLNSAIIVRDEINRIYHSTELGTQIWALPSTVWTGWEKINHIHTFNISHPVNNAKLTYFIKATGNTFKKCIGDVVLTSPDGTKTIISSWGPNIQQANFSRKDAEGRTVKDGDRIEAFIKDGLKLKGEYTLAFLYRSGGQAAMIYDAELTR